MPIFTYAITGQSNKPLANDEIIINEEIKKITCSSDDIAIIKNKIDDIYIATEKRLSQKERSDLEKLRDMLSENITDEEKDIIREDMEMIITSAMTESEKIYINELSLELRLLNPINPSNDVSEALLVDRERIQGQLETANENLLQSIIESTPVVKEKINNLEKGRLILFENLKDIADERSGLIDELNNLKNELKGIDADISDPGMSIISRFFLHIRRSNLKEKLVTLEEVSNAQYLKQILLAEEIEDLNLTIVNFKYEVTKSHKTDAIITLTIELEANNAKQDRIHRFCNPDFKKEPFPWEKQPSSICKNGICLARPCKPA